MALHESLCETPSMANMVVETLTYVYALAKGWDMAPEDHDDPCQSIPMNPKRKRERFLTDAEFTRLGQVLDESLGKGSRISAGAVTTIRLLMLTGCRKTEIMTLLWEHVDLDRAEIHIVNGKTGSRTVHLSPSAVIGIGGHLTMPPLPHHRAYGSVPRRFDRIRPQQGCRVWGGRASRNGGCVGPAGPPHVRPCASTPSASQRRWRLGPLRVPGGGAP